MQKLPDECFMNIFKSMNLQGQIAMYKVSPRLQHALRLLWQGKIELKHVAFDFFEHLPVEDFSILFSNIRGTVQSMCFHYDEDSDTFKVMTSYEYPQVRDVLIALNDFADDKLLTLVNMFPNVERLRLRGMGDEQRIDLLDLIPFANLKNLILDNCSFRHDDFIQLLKNSAITTLEMGSVSVERRLKQFGENLANLQEVSLNAKNLDIFTTGLLQHLNLKNMEILGYFRSPELVKRTCELLTEYSPATEIEVHAIADVSICSFPRLQEINFKKLVFGYIRKRAIVSKILTVISGVKALNEITFWSCCMDDEALIEFLLTCPVDKFNIISCTFRASKLRIDCRYIAAHRSKPLTIRHMGELELIGKSKLINENLY